MGTPAISQFEQKVLIDNATATRYLNFNRRLQDDDCYWWDIQEKKVTAKGGSNDRRT